MSGLRELSISEISQRLVDQQEASKEGKNEQTERIRQYIKERHSNYSQFKKDSEDIFQEIRESVSQYERENKKERERVIKRVVYQKMEIIILSLLEQKEEKGKRRKEKKEREEEIRKIVEETVSVAGSLLGIAITSHIYYPFVLQLVRLLWRVSVVLDVFIPVTYYPLYMMNQMAKISSSSIPLQPIPENVIRVGEKYVNSKMYSDYVMNNSLDIIENSLLHHGKSLSFPEYSAYIIGELKRVRNSPNRSSGWINSKIDGIVKGAREHGERIEKIRETIGEVTVEGIRRIEERIPELRLSVE